MSALNSQCSLQPLASVASSAFFLHHSDGLFPKLGTAASTPHVQTEEATCMGILSNTCLSAENIIQICRENLDVWIEISDKFRTVSTLLGLPYNQLCLSCSVSTTQMDKQKNHYSSLTLFVHWLFILKKGLIK